jgi:hypothetical protein
VTTIAATAVAVGAAAGVAFGVYDHQKRKKAKQQHKKMSVGDLEG